MIFSQLSFYLLIACSVLNFHPVHISVTNVDYMPEKEKMEISIKVFKKDLQLLFVHLNQLNIDFDNEESIKENLQRINNYFRNHLDIRCKSDFHMSYKDFRLDNEWIWFYYKVPIDKLGKEIEIRNTILLDLNYNQKNMLIFVSEQKEKGFLFNMKKTSEIIHLDEL